MRPRPPGFSLLEVLVALAILAVAMGALVRTAGMEAASLAQVRERSQAQWIAANLIAELRLQSATPATGSRDGRLEYARRDWRWQMDVAETGVAGIRRVDVGVGPADGPVTLTLTGFVGAR